MLQGAGAEAESASVQGTSISPVEELLPDRPAAQASAREPRDSVEALLLQEIDSARQRTSDDSPDTSTSDSAAALGALLQNLNAV